MNEVQEELSCLSNTMGTAYAKARDQKQILRLRQSNDIFFAKILEMSSPETIVKLQNETIKNFYKRKMLKDD